MSEITLRWIDSQLMTGVDSNGHPIVMGSWSEREPEWKGMKPSDLLLLSAASCSAYDVVMILKKQREPIRGLEVTCRGDQLTEPPYRFTHIHLEYIVEGEVNPGKLERAIRLSQEKYCSVINTLRPAVDITSDYHIR